MSETESGVTVGFGKRRAIQETEVSSPGSTSLMVCLGRPRRSFMPLIEIRAVSTLPSGAVPVFRSVHWTSKSSPAVTTAAVAPTLTISNFGCAA